MRLSYQDQQPRTGATNGQCVTGCQVSLSRIIVPTLEHHLTRRIFPSCNVTNCPGLPVEVRDKFLAEEDRLEVPGSDANREYMTQVHEKQLAEGGNPYSNKPLNQKVRDRQLFVCDRHVRDRTWLWRAFWLCLNGWVCCRTGGIVITRQSTYVVGVLFYPCVGLCIFYPCRMAAW